VLWRRPRFRFAALVLSQRSYAPLTLGLLITTGIGVAAGQLDPGVAGPAIDLVLHTPLAGVGNAAGLSGGAALSVLLVTLWLLLGLVLVVGFARLNRIAVGPAQCLHVLRRVERQQDFGEYTFIGDAPALEVRREARILDYLAKRGPTTPGGGRAVQAGRLGRFRLAASGMALAAALRDHKQADDVPGGMAPASSVMSVSEPATPCTRAARLLDEDMWYQAHTRDLIAYANQMWDDGAGYRAGWRLHRQFWTRARGYSHLVPRGEHLYLKPFFGNDFDQLFNWDSGFRIAGKNHPNFVTLVIKLAL
jgi:hypothetical protein